jgi:LAGLIDADG endonuclease
LGHQVLPQYRVYQHKRDIIVLKRIILTLNCGILIKPAYNRDEYTISVTNRKDLLEIIIPFFKKHPFYDAK